MSDTVTDELNSYLDGLVETKGLNGSVLVAREGELFLERGYGLADIELDVPNTPQTKFRIGSITKPFTALSVMLLQERGDLSVEDMVEIYVPDVPEAWKGIRLHHLLTHTSGIMHSWALPGFIETMAVRATSSETIDRFKDQPLIFKTGEGYSYSGVGYFLLGQVIEKVAGMSYEAFLREAILDPAGMKNTGPDRYDVLLPDRAAGYTPTEQGLQNAAPIFMPVLTGGGNLYSTVGDLWRFDRALTSGEFISEESYKQMYTTVRQGYGYGWRVANWSGYRGIMHGGGVSGFNAFLLRFPEQQVCVVVLSNVNPTPMRDISNRLASIVLDEPTLANPNG